MDHKLAKFQGSAMLSTRAVALFALVIAGVLGSWRASDLFTQPVESWVPGSAIRSLSFTVLCQSWGKLDEVERENGNHSIPDTVLSCVSPPLRPLDPSVHTGSTRLRKMKF